MTIERKSPNLDRILSVDQQLEQLGTGYDFGEGPLWWQEAGYLLFSEVRKSRRWKWTPQEGVTLFLEPTDEANGLTRDIQGRLIACHHATRRVTRMDPDGSITVVANNYRGLRLNRPNDVIVKSDGSIYFTDPLGLDSELDLGGVYRVSPDLGTINLVARDLIRPNGLAFSPDEKTLYVDDTTRGQIRAFDVQPTGLLNLASERVFAVMKSDRIGVADGLKIDVEGNIYCTGPGGVWIFAPSGEHLGTIWPGAQATNVAWGGPDWTTLFITTFPALLRIQLKIPGVPVPRKP